MTHGETAGTLNFLLQELREIDRAIRLGNARGVKLGADYWSPEHNKVMYEAGCPWRWRKNPDDDCMLPANTYQHAPRNGLMNLQNFFLDAVQNILEKYGPPPHTYINTYNT
jgi:hypothetical protein